MCFQSRKMSWKSILLSVQKQCLPCIYKPSCAFAHHLDQFRAFVFLFSFFILIAGLGFCVSVCPSPHHSCITSLVMVSSIQQHRSAIGSHNNFIKFKESANLWYILTRMQTLLDYYGPIVLLIFMNFPYCYAILVLCLWNVKLNTLKQKATFTNVSNDTPTKGVNTYGYFGW